MSAREQEGKTEKSTSKLRLSRNVAHEGRRTIQDSATAMRGGSIMHPFVIKVTVAENYRLWIEFDNSENGILDMAPYLGFGVFRKLQDLAVFNAARVAFDTVE